MPHRRSPEHYLVLVVVASFALTMLSFVASRVITELASRRVEREAKSIAKNALIATEALVATRTDLRKLVFEMNSLGQGDRPGLATEQSAQLDFTRRDTLEDWAKYASIPFYPGERSRAERVALDVEDVGRAVDEVTERLRQGDRSGALRLVDGHAIVAIGRADEGLERLLELNRQEAESAAERILVSSRPWGLLPEIVGALFAVVAAWFGVRLLAQYLAWAAERSAELEGFAGRVAHDIRSPLGGAMLALSLAQRGKDVDEKTRELLARVGGAMERIAKLVDGLLVFATSGGYIVPGTTLDEPKTSVANVLGGVVEDMKVEAEAKHIEIEYQAPDPALAVACSPGVFISITTNLTSNAMKFMGDALLRRITIRARQIGPYVEIAVSDTGPGISPELREQVFEPYIRGESTVPGFGLGLATVRKLAEAVGGTVGVDDSPEGGCNFWFRLPVWTDAPEKARSWPTRSATTGRSTNPVASTRITND